MASRTRARERQHWLWALLTLVTILTVVGMCGVSGAIMWGDAWVVRSAMWGWVLTTLGCLVSWFATLWFAGPLIGLFHVSCGFTLRAVVPLAIAAVMVDRQPAWQHGGLLWWTFSFYLIGLAADTTIFLRVLQTEGTQRSRE